MKTIKFLLVSLFVMLGTAAFAQDVVIHKTDGTTEVIENADSVVYDVKDYGYYSFNATSIAEIENLTATDFTKKLTNNIVTSDDGIQIDNPCRLAFALPIDKTNAPVIQIYNSTVNKYGANMTLVQYSDTPIIINNVNYIIWVATNNAGKSNTKFKFISF